MCIFVALGHSQKSGLPEATALGEGETERGKDGGGGGAPEGAAPEGAAPGCF